MSVAYDPLVHQRERTRKAEARAEMFERELAKALRLAGLVLRVATSDGKDAEPLALLGVLEDLDRQTQHDEAETDALVQLLRETDPDPDPARRPSA